MTKTSTFFELENTFKNKTFFVNIPENYTIDYKTYKKLKNLKSIIGIQKHFSNSLNNKTTNKEKIIYVLQLLVFLSLFLSLL